MTVNVNNAATGTQPLVSGDANPSAAQLLRDGYASEQAATAATGRHYLLRNGPVTADACTVTDQSGDPTIDATDPCTQRVNICGVAIESITSGSVLDAAQMAILRQWCIGYNHTLEAREYYGQHIRVASAIDKYGQNGNKNFVFANGYGAGGAGYTQNLWISTSSDCVYVVTSGFEPTFSIYVNGRRVTGSGGQWSADGTSYNCANNGQKKFLKLKFAAAADRVIRIANTGYAGFGDFYVRSTAYAQPAAPQRPTWLHMGDSFGTIASDPSLMAVQAEWSVVPQAMAESFGPGRWNFVNASVGATGIIKGTQYEAPVTGRLPNILAQYKIGCRTLDYSVFTALLGHNDYDQDITAFKSNLTELLTLVKSDRPTAIIRIFASNAGPVNLAGGKDLLLEDAVIEVCAALGIVGIRLQRTARPLWSTNSLNWLTGSDGTHPKYGSGAVTVGSTLARLMFQSI